MRAVLAGVAVVIAVLVCVLALLHDADGGWD